MLLPTEFIIGFLVILAFVVGVFVTLYVVRNKAADIIMSERYSCFTSLELSVLKESLFDLIHEYRQLKNKSETDKNRLSQLTCLFGDVSKSLEGCSNE